MKHKAEKSLSHITLCDRDKLHSHISDAYRNDISELHKLINCQLTVEELETIQVYLSNYARLVKELFEKGLIDLESLLIFNDSTDVLLSTNKKMNKQKEMWVSDDETN